MFPAQGSESSAGGHMMNLMSHRAEMCYTTWAAFHLSWTCVDCETKPFGSILKIVLPQPHTWVIPGFSCWCLQCGRGGGGVVFFFFFFYLVWWCSHCNIRGACPQRGGGGVAFPTRKTLEGDPQCHRRALQRREQHATQTRRHRGICPLSPAPRDAWSTAAARRHRMQRLCFSPADTFQPVQHLCAAEIFPAAAAAACGPFPSPPPPRPPPPPLFLLLLLHSSRRQDGQGALQSAPRVQQTQLFPVRPREAREDRVAQPRLRLPRFGGQPGSRAGEQHESAAAGAQEAAGRSAEQIHQPDPGLAEQVSTRRGRRAGGGGGKRGGKRGGGGGGGGGGDTLATRVTASCCYLPRPRCTFTTTSLWGRRRRRRRRRKRRKGEEV